MKKKRKIRKSRVLSLLIIIVIVLLGINIISGNYLSHFIIPNPLNGTYESKYIAVYNREEDKVIFTKDADHKTYPASLTKIMTVIVAIENIDNLNEIAPVDVKSYQEMVKRNSSMAGFFGRERVTYLDLLYGTMLPSGGEAANSLAINISGSVSEFVKLMNEKAKTLNLKNTNYTNVEGMDDEDQYTTANDLAILLDDALDNKTFKEVFTKVTYQTTKTVDHPNGITLTSTVLSKIEEEDLKGSNITGGKSGTTIKAGQSWATLGIKDNQEYIVITMGAELNDIKNPNMLQKEDTIELYSKIK